MKRLLLGVTVFFLGWDLFWWGLGVRPWFPWQLQARLAGGPAGPVLLDVRTPWEYNWFHLPGAQNVPRLLVAPGAMPPGPAAREIVILCMTGHRSPVVAYVLKKRGYTRVSHLTGGMAGWKAWEWFGRWGGRQEGPGDRP